MPNVQKRGVLARLAEVILFIPALLLMPLWDLGKALSKKAYGGSWVRGLFVGLTGVPVSFYGAYTAANYVGWQLGWHWSVWLIAGAMGFMLVGFIVWPALYLGFFKPLWDLCDKIFKVNRKIAENAVLPLSTSLISIVRHLPFSESLWGAAEGKESANDKPTDGDAPKPAVKRKWGLKVLAGALTLGGLGAGLSAGYFVYHAIIGLLPVFGALPVVSGIFLSQVVAAVLAITSLVLVTGFIGQYVEYGRDKEGREAFTAVAYSGIITFFAATKLAIISSLSLVALVPAAAAVFVVALAYVLPAFLALLQGGLMERLLKGWKKLLEAAYDAEEDKAYALFFAQVTTLFVAAAEAVVAYMIAGAVHLPEVITYILTGAVAVYSYASAKHDFGSSKAVSPIFGITLSIVVGVLCYLYAPASVAAVGFYHYAFGIGTAFFTGLFAYPVAYLALRFVTKPISGVAGPALASLNDKAASVYKAVADQVKKLQRAAFDDTTPFSGMFGHLVLLGVIAAAVFSGVTAAIPTLQFGFWVNTAITAFCAVNVYILLAKLSSRFGAETFALGAGGAALLAAGHWAFGLSAGNWWAAAVVGITAAGVVGGLVAPAIYLIVRPVANAILTPWLAPLLKTVFDGIWSIYVGFWNQFHVVFRFVRWIAKPVIVIVAGIWAGMRAAYARITGGRK